MQNEILEKNPELDVVVFAVWFNMIITDSKSRWPSGALTDRRVIHFWDRHRLVGGWYGQGLSNERGSGKVVWDAYYLYGPNSRWDGAPSDLEGWGSTILGTRAQLRRELMAVAARRAAQGSG